ncbi:MAG: MFS transporter [Flaviflexus sp.]|nr:MFS transporter [Flaviflexus sp.]
MNPQFARLWLSSTCSGLAVWALPFILGLGVARGSWSAIVLGWLLGMRTVGFLVAVPLGGVLADQVSRSKVTFWASMLACTGTVALTLTLTTTLPLALLAAFTFGLGQGASRPSYLALVREVVDEEHRQRANAALTTSIRLALLLGPAIAALSSRLIGDIGLIYATAGLWLFAAVLPLGLCSHRSPARGISRIGSDFLLGAREARRHAWFIAGLFSLIVVTTFGYSASNVIVPLVSRERFGSDAVLTFGLMAYTVSGILGALIISRWKQRNSGWWALAGNGVYALAPLALAVATEPWMIIATYVLVGIEFFNVPWFTAIQREVPGHLVARVSSVDFLFSYGLAPLGLAIIAPAVNAVGATAVLVTCSVACAGASALAMIPGPSRTFRTPTSKRPSAVRTHHGRGTKPRPWRSVVRCRR